MVNETPQIKDDPLYQLLREEKIDEFNQQRSQGVSGDLSGSDLRGLDLRGMIAAGLDMSGCYFRNTDIRGIDFTSTNLNGASFKGAKISGCFFPVEIHVDELMFSMEHGIRVRYQRP
ncbi:pentapeptide repeat-containing protein [Aestuariirhabdus sp. Z084]|uniref:pentapeptide repeat-containing protein n=1 Tax=Aestuariirhabdus haliotis TaxID=2918751 RepID=UPI00201B3E41|nr:pentapeptide repeat-containing protein [Aestuariirhabdus haliotis]MCL6414109.1 pentapeptide repeat-containing protein [Aestuariirhabdus haliotis]MCL6418041.1 pentapeptide repeat-containing protein [Aestuariirhabdus haliotis]